MRRRSRRLGQRPTLVIPDCLLDLLARVHDEWTVLHDRFEQRPTGKQNNPAAFGTTGELDAVAVGQHARVMRLERAP